MVARMVEWLGLCAFFLFLYVVTNWHNWFASEEQKAWRRYQAWVATRLDQGMTHDQIRDEREIRFHLAQLRETVSDHVASGGKATWEQKLRDEVSTSMTVLSSLSPELGKQFVNVVSGLHDSDILYPAEYERVHPMPRPVKLTPAKRKQWARTMNAALTDL